MIAGSRFDMGVDELGVQRLQCRLKQEFTSGIEGEPEDHILGPHYVSKILWEVISHVAHLEVQRIALVKPFFHFLDRLHRVLVEYFEIPDTVFGKKRTCDRPVHPVQS